MAQTNMKNNQFFQSRMDKTSGRGKSIPYGGRRLDDKSDKVTMPLKGKGVQITDKLLEMNERRERLEMVTYQQKMAG